MPDRSSSELILFTKDTVYSLPGLLYPDLVPRAVEDEPDCISASDGRLRYAK
jgi:hypothetical protein